MRSVPGVIPMVWGFSTVITFGAVLLDPGVLMAGVNTWTSLGPDGGGVNILAVDPQNPDRIYATTFAGLLFASTDGAVSWRAMSPLPAGTAAIFSLVVDPQNS